MNPANYFKKTFPKNISRSERKTRLIVGALFIALSFSGSVGIDQEFWLILLGWLGVMSGLIGHCPIYGVFGKSTYKTKD